MTEDFLLSIEGPAEGLYKEKGSKFLSFTYPVRSEKEVKELLSHLKKQFFDARHVCYAFVIGPRKEFYRASDAGEPAHTAGDPIMNEIRSRNLTNVLVVVVRYFGGTKLGKSGLILAYKSAAAAALNQVKIIEVPVTETFRIEFTYSETAEIMGLLNSVEAEISSQSFEAACVFEIAVKKSMAEEARMKLGKYLL